MKILIITQYFWPENFKINDFAASMQNRGHEVTVLTGIPNYPQGKFYKGYSFLKPKKEVYKNVNIVRTILFPRFYANGFWLFMNYLSFAFFSSIAVFFRINKKFDLILVWEISPVTVGIPAIILKKIKRIPVFFWVLDLWPESVFAASNLNSGFFENLIDILVKKIYKNCDRILVSSRGFIDSIEKKNVKRSDISYVPNWAEDEYLIPVEISIPNIDTLFPKAGLIIMFAGNIGEAQDFDSILKSIKLLEDQKDIKWIILGDGRKKEWLRQRINEKKLHESVIMLGKFPLDQMPYFYSKADVMLITLKDEYIFSLTVPAKLQTYMACKKPILAMLNGETARVLDEAKAGLTCRAGDFENLAKNVLEIYHMNTVERKTLSNNAFEYYKNHFDKTLIINQLENIFIDTLSNNK